MSLADLGRITAVHLPGARGKSGYLKSDTFRYLHAPIPPTGAGPLWGIGWVNWTKGKILSHSGSTLRNFALCHIVPDENFTVCIAANIWYTGINDVFNQINLDMVQLIQAGRSSK